MNAHGVDPEVFIRSVASRGHAGGLAPSSLEMVGVLEAGGYDTIFVESVGVGQSEVGILTLADVVAVVLHPGAGDDIQALKAGVMEIGDLYVVNKADRSGADRLMRSLREEVGHGTRSSLTPEILRTVATEDEGVSDLYVALGRRFNELEECGELDARRRDRLAGALEEMAADLIREWIKQRRLIDPRGGVPFAEIRRRLKQLLESIDTNHGREI